ncbi:MAG: flagellar export chaperone FlgN [Lachnospiraceae bacterium]|nr:flagellar export chaperone FlgN [Lachnospiraceae bacterium]
MAGSDYIRILKESLEKKVSVLSRIREKNEEQKDILTDQNSTPDELQQNLDEKGALIDEIVELDKGFEVVFQKVSEELEKNRSVYRSEILDMQRLIREITDLSSEIEGEEKENKLLAEQKFSYVRAQVTKVRKSQKAVSNYYHTMMKTNYEDPQFMDRKK